MAGQAVNHDDPRRFHGYMFLVVAYELSALRRELRANQYQLAQMVGCLNYMATKPSQATPNYPP